MRGLVALALLASCAQAPAPTDEKLCQLSSAPTLTIPLGDSVLQPLCDGVYTEPGTSEAQQRELKQATRDAQHAIGRAFGTLKGDPPLTLFCHTAACKLTFGATAESAPSNDLGFARDGVTTSTGYLTHPMVVVTGPAPRTAQILTHERVHAEMKAYANYDALPTWFNEGSAAYIADEPRCDAVPASSTIDVRQLDTKARWQQHLATFHDTLTVYCHARAEVAAWAAGFADQARFSAALKATLNRVSAGAPFRLEPGT
jgi:hypothetical protein